MQRGGKQNAEESVQEDLNVKDEEYVADVIVVGAGISGINFGYRLQERASTYSYVILEQRDAIGGTWDLMRFPGIRSDSDLATFGFEFKPWVEPEQIAKGHLILKYMRETASEYGIDKRIRFKHKVTKAEWSSETARWTLTVVDSSDGGASGCVRRMVCRFLVWGSGYFNYDEGLKTELNGLKNFKGEILHPQFWPENYSYDGKRVLIVGSGATAVTLLPAMAQKAGHVTMLQRSPTFIQTLPKVNRTADRMRAWFGDRIGYAYLRIKMALIAQLWYLFCVTFPGTARWFINRTVKRQLPKHIPFEPHFVPKYNPWQQRMCITPDGDFFEALRKGNCSIVTDHIDTFTEKGVLLKSGQNLEADVIVTATGIQVRMLGGAKMYVDGEEVIMGNKRIWKGSMLDNVPNAVVVVGYVNASWTLGSDLCAQLTCSILNDLARKKCDIVVPKLKGDEKFVDRPLLNLTSTYLKEQGASLPKSSTTAPWVARKSFFSDVIDSKFAAYGDTLHWITSSAKPSSEKTKLL